MKGFFVMSKQQQPARLTVRDLRRMREAGEPIVCLTAYDALFARLSEDAGIHLLLVGDSLGMTVLGYKSTVPVTLEQSLHHTAAVVRGTRRALVVGDMPFMTYQVSAEQALLNAARYLQEAGADAVKLEGGVGIAPTARRLVQAGVPVLGHVGLLPQRVNVDGGYRVYGRSEAEAAQILEDALALEEAGAFGVVLEGVPAALAKKITGELHIPTIGIGAGAGCSGQVQVVHDILGLFEEFVPKHTRPYANLAGEVRQALKAYAADVESRKFPGKAQSW